MVNPLTHLGQVALKKAAEAAVNLAVQGIVSYPAGDKILHMDRKLPERSRLIFEFPTQPRPFVAYLPFFENIKISESKSANYAKYNPIARSSPLFAYTGAEARRIKLKFNMSLPHIVSQMSVPNMSKYITGGYGYWGSKAERDKFFKSAIQNTNATSPAGEARQDFLNTLTVTETIRDSAGNYLELEQVKARHNLYSPDINEDRATSLDNLYSEELSNGMKTKMQVINVINYWISLIRSSVVNNADFPAQGPPIIRLSHGILYQESPFICQDYSININDQKGGYDVQTLLPRIIEVNMNLDEVRAGNFTRFGQGQHIIRDNLAGWEQLMVDGGTMESGDLG